MQHVKNESHEAAINPQRERIGTIETPIISNEIGLVSFNDLLNELLRQFEVEKNAKNQSYHFIIKHGHFDAYRKFYLLHQGKEIDNHAECIRELSNLSN